jgi:hypothetical protein
MRLNISPGHFDNRPGRFVGQSYDMRFKQITASAKILALTTVVRAFVNAFGLGQMEIPEALAI